MNSLQGRITNRQLIQRFVQRLQSLKFRNDSTATSNISSSSDKEPEFIIPFRKERGPTDILYALEKTILQDPTAADYKYHDDPYLIPISNKAKRTYALSKESGRKAAMWVLAEHSNLFNHRIAEPEVKAFLPKPKYEKKEEVSEELLLSVIREGSMTDVLTIYNILKNEISIESKQALLEFLCFHNCQEQLSDDLTEERWYRRAVSRQKLNWRSSQELEELFQFLIKQDKPIASAAYNAMICGTAKYMNVGIAWNLYEECQEKNIPLCLETYNNVIQLIPVLRDGAGENKTLLFELLAKINEVGLSPNLQTFNSALRVAASIKINTAAGKLIRSLFTEFKELNINPCLTSYYYVLITLCRDNGPRCTVLCDILDELEGKLLTMQDSMDTFFFTTAMDVAKNHLDDPEIAERVHNLLLTDNNYDFIGENYKESIYYRHYVTLFLKHLPFEEFIKFYDTIIPNIYMPEPTVMEEILNAIELSEPATSRDFLSRLWSQMVMFDHIDRGHLTLKAFNLMRTHCAPAEDSPINSQYAEAAWFYWTYFKGQKAHRLQSMSISGSVYADIAILSLKGDRFDRSLEVIDALTRDRNLILGSATIQQMEIILQACLERGHASGALLVLKYCVEEGYPESVAMAKKIDASISLTANQKTELDKMIGPEINERKSTSDVSIKK